MTTETKPLGARINQELDVIRNEAHEIRYLAINLRCDDELPPKSRLTESHLDDLKQATLLLSQAAGLMGNLTQEALDELSE